MSGKEVLIQTNQRFLEVSHLGGLHRLEVAQSVCQLEEAKILDDLVFGKHLGITMDELINIMNNGAVLLLRDSSGKLIGESQVITSPILQHTELAEDEAYNYGTAISPELQNNGTAQILFKGQEIIAKEAGKSRSTLTVRLENAQSIRGRFKAGFQVVGYDPTHYGSVEQDGARLIMEKHFFEEKREVFDTYTLLDMIADGNVVFLDDKNIDRTLDSGQDLIGVYVNSGDVVDLKSHNLILKIFSTQEYIGIGLLKSTEINAYQQNASLLIFKKINGNK